VTCLEEEKEAKVLEERVLQERVLERGEPRASTAELSVKLFLVLPSLPFAALLVAPESSESLD
jgi:hypothetical protein